MSVTEFPEQTVSDPVRLRVGLGMPVTIALTWVRTLEQKVVGLYTLTK